jgi:predicted HTH transcriptional regulator
MILFGKNDQRLVQFPNSEISCARFAGTTKADFIDRLDLKNSSLLSIEEIPKFIRRNTAMAAEFGDIKRNDISQYPINAIREVLLNALMHANYELRGSRFYVAIFDDRLEIQNPGNFPPGLTLEDFKAGISKIRNPMIARVFREKESLEAWGSGYERICKVCEKGGYPLPEWEEVGPIIRVTFYPLGSILRPAMKKLMHADIELSSRQMEIITLLEKHRALSTKELMSELSNPPTDRWLRTELNQLVKLGYIKTEGATSSRKWLLAT